MTQRIMIPLIPVTKKNSSQIIWNKSLKRPMLIPSKIFTQYQQDCGIYLKNVDPFLDPCNLECKFYMPTRRRVDLSNLISAISDVLVHYGILIDDNSKYIKGYDGSRVLYDKESPRTEIVITEWDEEERRIENEK